MSDVIFHCPKLQKAYEETKDAFSKKKEWMTNISSDILTFERLLQEMAIATDVTYIISDVLSIRWDRKSGRILCIDTTPQTGFVKNLAECKFIYKEKCHECLSEFIFKLMSEEPEKISEQA